MDAPQDPNSLAGLLGAAAAALISGVLWLRTKLSRDATAIANDRAEVDMITRLQNENKDLRCALVEVTEERNKLVREVGEMAGSIKALEASQQHLKGQVEQLMQQILTMRKALERTGHERRNP